MGGKMGLLIFHEHADKPYYYAVYDNSKKIEKRINNKSDWRLQMLLRKERLNLQDNFLRENISREELEFLLILIELNKPFTNEHKLMTEISKNAKQLKISNRQKFRDLLNKFMKKKIIRKYSREKKRFVINKPGGNPRDKSEYVIYIPRNICYWVTTKKIFVHLLRQIVSPEKIPSFKNCTYRLL